VIEAYVLIQTEIGRQLPVATALSEMPGVTQAVVVTGPYDVIARISAADVDALGSLIITKIQSVDGVVRTLTSPIVHI
jgi:DNA-binding Lrp family transcriptional regulator